MFYMVGKQRSMVYPAAGPDVVSVGIPYIISDVFIITRLP